MTKAEAIKLCEKYGVDISVHSCVIVTANGNIYLSQNIDPKDNSERFDLKTEDVEFKEIKPETVNLKKERKK
jgi:hypothetical protein